MEVDRDIDVLGKVCPIPLISLAKEIRTLGEGKVLRITGDDPVFEESVLDFIKENGCELLENQRDGRRISIVFRV